MKKPLLAFSFILSIFCCGQKLYAQSNFCPPNIDLELGNFNNWYLYTGTCCPISTPTPGPAVPTRHTLTSGTATDMYGGFPIVAPGGGVFSLKLGNNSTGAQAERARYYVQVPAGSSKYIFIYRYAVVFQDPNHATADQPRFEVKAYDSATGDPIPCSQYTYVSSSNLPGFYPASTGSSVYYKPWTTASLNLTGYGGRTVALDFASGDCALGGHFGYGYVDMNCGLFSVYSVNCNATSLITLQGPPGFQSYAWYDSSFTTYYGSGQTIAIPIPSTPVKYAVILTPYTGFGCPDTLYTVQKVVNTTISVTAPPDTTICLATPLLMNTIVSSNDTPVTYLWAPATGLSCTTCKSPTASPTSHQTYVVIGTNASGCSAVDTVKIKVDSAAFGNIQTPKDSVCIGELLQMKDNYYFNPPTPAYTWSVDGGTIVTNQGDTTINVRWATYGLKRVTLNVLDGKCSYTDTQGIFVKANLTVNATPDTTICLGSSKQLKANAVSTVGPLLYSWSPAAGLSCATCANTTTTTTYSITYYLSVSHRLACGPVLDTVRIKVDTIVLASLSASKDTFCQNEPIQVINSYTSNPPTAVYTWTDDAAIVINGTKDTKLLKWQNTGLKTVKLKVSDAGCISSDSVKLVVLEQPIIQVSPDTTICQGESAQLNINVLNTTLPVIYSWFPITGLSCTNCPNPVATPLSSVIYSIAVGNNHNCVDSGFIEVTVDSSARADIQFPKDTICRLEEILFKNIAIFGVGAMHTWTTDTANILGGGSTPAVTLNWPKPGLKKVVLHVSTGTCSAADSVNIFIQPDPIASFELNYNACLADPVNLYPKQQDAFYYWTIEGEKVSDTVFKSPIVLRWFTLGKKRISLKLIDRFGCASPEYDTAITVRERPVATIGQIDQKRLCAGDTVFLHAQPGKNYRYEWAPQSYFLDNDNPDVSAIIPKNSFIVLRVVNEWECSDVDTIYMNSEICCKVFFPDAFTPNGDGRNDKFRLLSPGQHTIHTFLIANRWGKVIYQSEDAVTGWDGTYKGEPQDPDTYFYYLKYYCDGNEAKEEKGNFILIR
jgi:gliding motility-associated-like protein